MLQLFQVAISTHDACRFSTPEVCAEMIHALISCTHYLFCVAEHAKVNGICLSCDAFCCAVCACISNLVTLQASNGLAFDSVMFGFGI
jgi:hypothetical protein